MGYPHLIVSKLSSAALFWKSKCNDNLCPLKSSFLTHAGQYVGVYTDLLVLTSPLLLFD